MMRCGFWMHVNSMDVCLEVCRVPYYDAKRVKVKGRWWNLGYTGNPWMISGMKLESLEIPTEQLKNWVFISGKTQIARTKPGLP